MRGRLAPVWTLLFLVLTPGCAGPGGAHAAAAWNDRVVIVAADVQSEASLGRFPFNRAVYARLVDRLSAAGVAVIGFDIDFDLAKDAAGDGAFHDSLVASRVPVVLGYGSPDLARVGGSLVMTGEDFLPSSTFRCVDQACSVPIPEVHLSTQLVILDRGGRLTAVPMVLVPTCHALSTCPISTLHPMGFVVDALANHQPVSLGVADHRVVLPWWSKPLPVDSDSAAPVVFAGGPGAFKSHRQYYSMGSVLAGSVPASAFAGKVVIVGSYLLPQSRDSVLTPTSSTLMAGVEAQANIAAMFLGQSWAGPVR